MFGSSRWRAAATGQKQSLCVYEHRGDLAFTPLITNGLKIFK